METEVMPVGLLGCNCVLLVDESSRHAVVVDPGGSDRQIAERIKQLGVSVDAILHTHAHIDHVGATAEIQQLTQAPAWLHAADWILYDELLPVQAAMIGCPPPAVARMEPPLTDGQVIKLGALELRVLHTPGHSAGSVCFWVQDRGESHLVAGDTLFRRGIGRTDLWGGDSQALLPSVRERLWVLPGHTLVIPGHGPTTTIEEEERWHQP